VPFSIFDFGSSNQFWILNSKFKTRSGSTASGPTVPLRTHVNTMTGSPLECASRRPALPPDIVATVAIRLQCRSCSRSHSHSLTHDKGTTPATPSLSPSPLLISHRCVTPLHPFLMLAGDYSPSPLFPTRSRSSRAPCPPRRSSNLTVHSFLTVASTPWS
jgi:hypothetical protein